MAVSHGLEHGSSRGKARIEHGTSTDPCSIRAQSVLYPCLIRAQSVLKPADSAGRPAESTGRPAESAGRALSVLGPCSIRVFPCRVRVFFTTFPLLESVLFPWSNSCSIRAFPRPPTVLSPCATAGRPLRSHGQSQNMFHLCRRLTRFRRASHGNANANAPLSRALTSEDTEALGP